MEHSNIFLTVLALVLYLGGTTVFAQHDHGLGVGHNNAHGASMDHGNKSANPKSVSTKDPGSKNTLNEQLAHNTHLSSKLQSLLPANVKLQDAADGFKNMGQFVAAVHVSHNLNIPFDQLKGKMTGKPPMSLGKAIHELHPNVDAKAETKKAEDQAKKDIEGSKVENKEADQREGQHKKESRS